MLNLFDGLAVTAGQLPDATSFAVGDFNLFWAICAIAGGMFGVAIGGNWAFVMTGFAVIFSLAFGAATGSDAALGYVAFGPVFGPHVCFTGGAVAAAYAGRKGLLEGGGRDINSSLAGLANPKVYFVGGLFGLLGYTFERCIRLIPFLGGHTDTVALTVLTMGIVARILWGQTGFFLGWTSKLEGSRRWLSWQETPAMVLIVGTMASIFAAGGALMLAYATLPEGHVGAEFIRANAHTLPFAISAITIFFLILGYQIPVTHHITISAALGALVFFPIVGSGLLALLVGWCFGMLAAILAEVAQRAMYAHGDTHIDPPAAAIWVVNTAIASAAMLCG